MRSQYGPLSPDFYIHVLLILKVWMVIFSMIYPPSYSITENSLKTFISVFLDYNKKIFSLEKFFSPTRLIFQYMKALSNSDKLRAFIAPKMEDLITYLDNNVKSVVYKGGGIHWTYCYLDMIGSPITLTTSGQWSNHFSPSYSIKNDTAYLQPVITALCTRQKNICDWCGIFGNKYDAYIMRGPKLLPSSLRRSINQFNTLHDDEPN